MDLQTIKNMVSSEEYNFLRNNDHLGDRIILIGLGGSHAYGTNNETSDLDVRGCALNSKEEILTNQHYEQFVDEKTDTTVYAFNKLISLLCNCNPNTIEMLGLKPEHYLFLSPVGQELLHNKDLFLSKKAAQAFGGYATAWSEMHNVVKDYAKVGKRNKNAIEHNKLGKHMMHLIRLYMMCLDILERKEIVTFREKEHELLMSIRNGEYLDGNRQPIPEFFEMVDDYEKKMKYAKENTDLPEKPDYKAIQEFVMDVNERVVRGLI